MAEFPALPLWTDAYLADTGHLTDAQHGLYLKILILIWRSPQCRIPNNDEWISRKLSRAPEFFRPLLEEFCRCSEKWVTQKRLLREWKWVKNKSQKNAFAAKSRWEKEKALCKRNAPTPTPTPTPTPKTDKKKEVQEILNGFGIGKRAGIKNGVTIQDPSERLARFQRTIAEGLGKDGYAIVGAASDPSSPEFDRCVALCQAKALELNKGWPLQWPKRAAEGR